MTRKFFCVSLLLAFLCLISISNAQDIGVQCDGSCYSYYFNQYSCTYFCHPCTGTCYYYYLQDYTLNDEAYITFYESTDYYCTGSSIDYAFVYCYDCSTAEDYNVEFFLDECYDYGSSSAVFWWVWMIWVFIFCCVCCCICGCLACVLYFLLRTPKTSSECAPSAYYYGAPQQPYGAPQPYDQQYQQGPQQGQYPPGYQAHSGPIPQFYPQYQQPQPQFPPQHAQPPQ